MTPQSNSVDWWLTGLCTARAFNGFIFLTYAAALPVLQIKWQMSAAAAGAIAGSFQISYALSLITFSALADRLGAKKLYLTSMTSSAVTALLFATLARDYWSGFILYTLVAFSLGGSYTTALIIITDRYPVQKRGMAMGFYIASTSMGYAASLMISGYAIPLGGYPLAFMLTAIGPLIGALLAWIILLPTAVRPPQRSQEQNFISAVLTNRPAMYLIGSYTGHSWELLGMWAWTPAFLSACLVLAGHADVAAAGLGAYIAAAFHLTGLLASFTMGSLSDSLGRTRVCIFLAAASTAISFFYGWTIGLPVVLVSIVGMIYAFTSLGDSPVLSAAMSEVVPSAYLGAAFGLRSFLGFGAGAISPIVFGFVLDATNRQTQDVLSYQNWGWAFVTLGIGGLIAVTAMLLLHHHWRSS